MFFGTEKINRKSCSEEKKVRGKIVYFYGLESGLGNARRKTFRVARRFTGRRERFSTIFFRIFYNFSEFSTIFLEFSAIFLENFPKNFCNFFRLLRFPYDFSRKFFPKFFSEIFPKILAHNPLRFNRGFAIIVSLQLSLHLSLHPYL